MYDESWINIILLGLLVNIPDLLVTTCMMQIPGETVFVGKLSNRVSNQYKLLLHH